MEAVEVEVEVAVAKRRLLGGDACDCGRVGFAPRVVKRRLFVT